ncbi:hypothetical protein AGMMS50212_02200 [Spirochaetia bacterium]|nr:hypothetical protein AGMMS50212_02200 [Spirochaetia bacterium]
MKNMLSMIPQAVTLIKTNATARIIFIVALLLILLIVGIPLIQKIKRKRIKAKETRNILKDLMVWRHVAQLVKGGEDQNKVKNLLSDRIQEINFLLNQGFALPAQYKRKNYDLPWYILLGEPHSGKSSLLSTSELELIPSAVETAKEDSNGKDSLPVRMWLGAKSVVCDISGHVFFDRWLDGSSAEWNYIIEQLYRRRRRRPLDGIILTIPADSLLADDDMLSQKKAILMATELSQLFHTLGMYLPCQVVVTKLDMVDGFREYIMGIPEEMRHQILGFSNTTRLYETATFKEFWDALLQRLRVGCKKIMISRAVSLKLPGAGSRMDLTGKMYLFPENFATLYKNLNTYLNTLFSENNFHGSKNMVFEGIYFTSATDLGITLSQGLAALAGKKVDEFPLTDVQPANTRSYFIRDLLNKVIFTPSPNAIFTFEEQAKKFIPLYALSAGLLVTGIVWFSSAIFRGQAFRMSLSPAVDYYTTLDASFRARIPHVSPLITRDASGEYVIDNSSVDWWNNSVSVSRVQYFYEIYSYRERNMSAPLGFKMASLMFFGANPNMGYSDRAFVHNQVFGLMVRAPLIQSLGQKFIEYQNRPVILDANMRQAVHSFLLLEDLKNEDFYRIFSSKDFQTLAMLKFLMPNISNDSIDLLNSYQSRYDKRHMFSTESNYVLSGDFVTAGQAAMNTMLNAWDRLTTYPDSLYGKMKTLVMICYQIISNYTRINSIAAHINEAASIDELRQQVTEWKNLSVAQNELINDGRSIFDDISKNRAISAVIRGVSLNPGYIDIFSDNHISNSLFQLPVLNLATTEYTNLFNADMKFLEKKVGSNLRFADAGQITMGRIRSLRGNFSRGLSNQIDDLRRTAQGLNSNDLMTKKITDDPKETMSLFAAVERILNLAAAPELITPETLRKAEFMQNWQKLQAAIQTAADGYDSFVKPMEANERLASLITGERDMMLALATLNRYTVIESGLDLFSSTEPQIAASVREKSKDENIFTFSNQAMEVLLGKIIYDKSYDPIVVKSMVGDFIYFAQLFAHYNNPEMQKSFAYFQEFEAFRSYLEHYIDYWGTFPDTAYPKLTNWTDYKARLRNYQSYQINSVIQTLYTKSVELLNQIDDTLLTEIVVKKKAAYTASMNDKIVLLSMFFNDNTNKMLSAWSRLPADPETAFKTLQLEEVQAVKDIYMTAYSEVKELSVGWWNAFTENGFNILIDNYYNHRLEEFGVNMEAFNSFPFCSDATIHGALSLKEIGDFAWLLTELGAGIVPGAEADTSPVAGLHRDVFRGGVAKKWAQTIQKIAVAASDRRKPLVWTVNQPPIDVQSGLSIPGKLNAVNRFRYIEVSSGRNTQRFTTYEKTETALAQGNVTDSELRFKFYVMSTDIAPVFEFSINNPWAIFSLYLKKDGIRDQDGKRYIPIYISDQSGEYVYFVTVDFSTELPGIDDWYDSDTWPEITVMDGVVEANRRIFSPGGVEIQPAGTAGTSN